MTRNDDFKRLVRKRMSETGESYTVARAHFEAPPKHARDTSASVPATIDAFKKMVFTRARSGDLAAHLENRYGTRVSQTTELDVGVYRVDRGGEPSWVARIFPRARTMDTVRGDADILRYLERAGFTAERPAHDDAVSVLAGQPVLVTEYVPGTNRRSDQSEATFRSIGEMLGRLHTLPVPDGACRRPAGSWHALSVNGGGRRSDVDVLLALLDDAASSMDGASSGELREALDSLDDLDDLPKALIHPDPCGANLVALDDGPGVLVDWTGAGYGPRVGSLALLIGTAGSLSFVDAAVAGYRQHASLGGDELARLDAALVVFPFILDCWTVLFQGATASEAMHRLGVHRQRAQAIAERARAAFSAPVVRPVETEPAGEQPPLF